MRFNVSQSANVQVKVYAGADTSDEGAVVRTFTLELRAGGFSVTWDGTSDTRLFTTKGIHTFQIVAEAGIERAVLDPAAQVNAIGLPDLSPVRLVAGEEDGRTRLGVTVRNTGEEPAENVLVRLMYGSQNIGEMTIASLPPHQEQQVSLL